ncbi:hypothetical protein NKOR_07475 [Candidatus Nitrosopumilus koreensis AR1]|uniref:Uncharacterized protein n=1 Tax=Candidatus Nitrosopumilus koreensis AR1 TaxID=1229908 RepID=K0BA83_9ARCH|nr:hypothetical protein NKOR_07475 [Candidatus Nitrosopumilus koreensis AR1]
MDEVKFEELCKQIFAINEKIRFVGIVENNKFFYKMREGINSYLSKKTNRRISSRSIEKMGN